MKTVAFEGLRVVDFTIGVAGPLMAKCLADFGATVVKVETGDRPDPVRVSWPLKDGIPGLDRSGHFASYNPNKLSFALNLQHPAGPDIARRLSAWSDVVIESFTPGTMERWGLGYDDLLKVRPDIIMLRTCNLGQTGPWSKQPGYGYHLGGLAGFIDVTGWPDRSPPTLPMAYPDIIAPPFGVAAVVAALDFRKRTGRGQCIDLSQLEASLHLLIPPLLDFAVNERRLPRQGNSCPTAAPHGVYRCQGNDRWCAIACLTSEDWQVLARTVGAPWVHDPRFATAPGRKRYELELDRLVEAWTVGLPPEEVVARLQPGIPAAVVQNARDIMEDEQVKWRGFFYRLDHPQIGPLSHLGQPFILSDTPARGRLPGPCLGEHTEMVCREYLGMSDEELAALVSKGVLT